MKKLKNIWSKRKPGSRGRGVRRDYFFFDRCHNFFLPTVRRKKEIEKVCCPFVVQGENAQHKTG
ncbi:hypothetical protein [Faecousia sp.]|uniref:hypothetical protein n=1 Tax=Faecousia sp. TaxID=2952921 RepID=UPI003AB30E76